MPNKIKKIEELEKQLTQFEKINTDNLDLESLNSFINNKIVALMKLKDEMKKVSDDMFYYDMINYMGNIPCKKLTLIECCALLKDLEAAKKKFEEDSDQNYLISAQKMKDKVILRGINICIQNFKTENFVDAIAHFYRLNEKEIQNKIMKKYFKIRKKNINNKISECIKDLRKNYKLLILGEIQCFNKSFDKDLLNTYQNKDFSIKNQNEFESFLSEIFLDIFKKLKSDYLKDFLEDIKQHNTENINDNILNKFILNITEICFKSDD